MAAKHVLFVVLVLDLIGFSCILPLFPQILRHYHATSTAGDAFDILKQVSEQVRATASGSAEDSPSAELDTVMMGGLLGALFSLLQFLSAPFIGRLSDRVGRRPVLLACLAGTLAASLLWLRASSFALFVASRVVGGITRGTTHLAYSVMADVTSADARAHGMALIGVTFALGFIVGPASGAYMSVVDLPTMLPASIAAFAAGPLSMPALLTVALTCFNLLFVAVAFPETLPAKKAASTSTVPDPPVSPNATAAAHGTTSLSRLFGPSQNEDIDLTALTYFLFLVVFAGMEFTLSFLAAERFGFQGKQQGRMFAFIGIVWTLLQGGYVRRAASKYGEVSVAVNGVILTLPGYVALAVAGSTRMLYLGLVFIAFGSATVIPALTALVSLYADRHSQGASVGRLRSLGALARAIGPLLASTLYWRYGSTACYLIGAAAALPAVYAVQMLKQPEKPAQDATKAKHD